MSILWNYCAFCGRRIETGEKCYGLPNGESVCTNCCVAENEGVGAGGGVMTELKPCPFCGCDVRFDEAYSYFRDTVIYCDGCDMVFTLDDCKATAAEIAEAWNRRADND